MNQVTVWTCSKYITQDSHGGVLNWVNRVRSYVCVCAIQRDVYESDCVVPFGCVTASRTHAEVSVKAYYQFIHLSQSSFFPISLLFQHLCPSVLSLNIFLRAQTPGQMPLNAFDNFSHQPSSFCLFHSKYANIL